jgi:hypothetical protein
MLRVFLFFHWSLPAPVRVVRDSFTGRGSPPLLLSLLGKAYQQASRHDFIRSPKRVLAQQKY